MCISKSPRFISCTRRRRFSLLLLVDFVLMETWHSWLGGLLYITGTVPYSPLHYGMLRDLRMRAFTHID